MVFTNVRLNLNHPMHEEIILQIVIKNNPSLAISKNLSYIDR
ncbi:MAG TPA: hypothetical protein PK131_00825 [Candidatus Woesebacteria bacterium]|nr:hypothetical protein [Candidatus Woesebacteria bacterium]